ncbi:HigA family addiction module antidote protein [Ectothiorhodospiraceae bacterium WFHF3C12]|nr:HigA family addiction module antidote protein [Ectothiorhodospiraceae bacterium WFHF3C12]
MTIDRNKLHETRFDDVAPADEERDSPILPGEILYEDFMEPLGLSAAALARALHVPPNRITALINGQRGLTADTALRLARYFGTTPEFWIRLQADYDLRQARHTVASEIEREISPRVA